MRIEFMQHRVYAGIGERKVGDIAEVDDAVGRQFIAQGFAVEVRKMTEDSKARRTAPRPATDK